MFIAVITETFAEIRVQFSQMWGAREMLTEEEIRQVKTLVKNLLTRHFVKLMSVMIRF